MKSEYKYTRAKELENKTYDQIVNIIQSFEVDGIDVIYYADEYNKNLTKDQIKDLLYCWCAMHF